MPKVLSSSSQKSSQPGSGQQALKSNREGPAQARAMAKKPELKDFLVTPFANTIELKNIPLISGDLTSKPSGHKQKQSYHMHRYHPSANAPLASSEARSKVAQIPDLQAAANAGSNSKIDLACSADPSATLQGKHCQDSGRTEEGTKPTSPKLEKATSSNQYEKFDLYEKIISGQIQNGRYYQLSAVSEELDGLPQFPQTGVKTVAA